ncbi:hypothetical protein [Alistipes sp.]|uniref:hypothetical protein n=1 Tax=Alistipes sp. TaxID=1872444 RepID=UPI003A89D4B7
MKKLYRNFASKLVAVASMAAAVACSAEDGTTPPPSSAEGDSAIRISLTATAEGTRTTLNATDLIKWNADDAQKMGLFASYEYESRDYMYGDWSVTRSRKVYQSDRIELGENPKTALFSFQDSRADGDLSRNYKITSVERAVYPFTTEYATSAITFTVDGEQKQSAAGETTYGAASVPMVGIPTEHVASEDRKSVSCLMPMRVLSSIIAFYVFDSSQSYAGESVKSIEFQSEAGNVSGDSKIFWSDLPADGIPVLTGTRTMVKTSLETAFAVDGVTEKSQSSPIFMSVVPGSFTGRIVVETDKAMYFYPVSSPKTFERASVKEMTLNLSGAKADRMDKSAYVKPDVRYVRLVRTGNTSTTVTVKRSNDAAVGFHIFGKFTYQNVESSAVTKEEVMGGSVYRFGAADNDSSVFELQDDGSVVYKVPNNASYSNVTWGVIAFDKYGMYGPFKYEYGYGVGSTRPDVTSGFDYDY